MSRGKCHEAAEHTEDILKLKKNGLISRSIFIVLISDPLEQAHFRHKFCKKTPNFRLILNF